MHSKLENRAFTLIELLVAVAIMALLTAIIISNLTQAKGKSRDAKRVSDLAQIQLALELFFDRCNQYPSTLAVGANNNCPSGITLGTFISQIPTAPSPGYQYGVKSDLSDYVLKATLESNNAALVDRYTGSAYSPITSCAGTYEYCVVPK